MACNCRCNDHGGGAKKTEGETNRTHGCNSNQTQSNKLVKIWMMQRQATPWRDGTALPCQGQQKRDRQDQAPWRRMIGGAMDLKTYCS